MRLQPRQPFGRQQVVGLPGRRTVQGNQVHPCQHLVQIVPPGRPQLFGDQGRDGFAVVIVDLHPERFRAPGQGLADPAHADDAEPLAPQFPSGHPGRGPALEPALGHDPGPLDDAATDRQDQGHGQIRRVLGQDARRIGHDQAAAHSRVDIDVIHTRAEIGDHLQLVAGRGDQGAVDGVGNGRDQHIGPLHRRLQRSAVHGSVGQIQFGVEQFAHARFDCVGQPSG